MQLCRPLVVTLVLVMTLFAGCSRVQLGIRPDLPSYNLEKGSCENLKVLYDKSAELEQAYRWRAAWNRNSIWVAGVFALATIAATGGLGAAGAASLAIAIVSVSGGFVSGSFALFDNDTLARHYTTAANDVATALKAVHRASNDAGECSTQMATLSAEVTRVANELETNRTDVAVAAAGQGLTDQKAALRAEVSAALTAIAATATPAPTAVQPAPQ